MDALIGNIKNGFQNAFTFYLSGLLYEADKQFDDAYIDYKKALEINSDNSYLQQMFYDLLKNKGLPKTLKNLVNNLVSLSVTDKPNTGQVIVIAEQGLIPAKTVSIYACLFIPPRWRCPIL